jgi:hypothetical protein
MGLEWNLVMINSTSQELRDWARRCAEQAASAATEEERQQMLRKWEALSALADAQDWLDGRLPSPSTAGADGAPPHAGSGPQAAE